jgi:type IV secretory pathway VirB2 component (pilin)
MRNRIVSRPLWRHAFAACALFAAASFTSVAIAQSEPATALFNRMTQGDLPQSEATLNLPDAPGVARANSHANSIGNSADLLADAGPQNQNSSSSVPSAASAPNMGASTLPEASHTQRYPLPGQPAPVLTAHDKVVMGFQGAFSPYAAVGWLAAAGYEQLTNSTPNYGTDRGAFGQRLGASAIRAISEDVLADSVLAPAFHEDPRYYRLGSGHNFVVRVVYAASRALITRSDSGHTVPNFSQIGANLAGAVLTNAYYPQSNRTAAQTIETFGGSLGGTALGNGIAEFFGGLLFDHHPTH